MTILDGWRNFYVIVGSSAGALIGLQFVVITLIAAKPIPGADAQTGGAFATPTVVHFGVAGCRHVSRICRIEKGGLIWELVFRIQG